MTAKPLNATGQKARAPLRVGAFAGSSGRGADAHASASPNLETEDSKLVLASRNSTMNLPTGGTPIPAMTSPPLRSLQALRELGRTGVLMHWPGSDPAEQEFDSHPIFMLSGRRRGSHPHVRTLHHDS
jgi:hypothetical protein